MVQIVKPTSDTRAKPCIESYTSQVASETNKAVLRQNLISSFS